MLVSVEVIVTTPSDSERLTLVPAVMFRASELSNEVSVSPFVTLIPLNELVVNGNWDTLIYFSVPASDKISLSVLATVIPVPFVNDSIFIEPAGTFVKFEPSPLNALAVTVPSTFAAANAAVEPETITFFHSAILLFLF